MRASRVKLSDPRWGYWEDGIYASIMVTQYLSQNNLTLGQALESIPVYFNYQKNLSISTRLDYTALYSLVTEKYPGMVDHVEDIDGIKVYLKPNNSWIMLRSLRDGEKGEGVCRVLQKKRKREGSLRKALR